MATGQFVAYYRVSTLKQGQSGLGLEAQRAAVLAYLNGSNGQLIGEFTEVETAKGVNALVRRPQLREALSLCKKRGAVLVIAKLDRLARNVAFVSALMETGCEFVAADMPQANKVMIQMHAVMSEWERDQISQRTKVALAAAKAKGVRLGAAGPNNLRPNIQERQRLADEFAIKLRHALADLKSRGLSQRQQVFELNSLGVRTAAGRSWSLIQLQRCQARLEHLKLSQA